MKLSQQVETLYRGYIDHCFNLVRIGNTAELQTNVLKLTLRNSLSDEQFIEFKQELNEKMKIKKEQSNGIFESNFVYEQFTTCLLNMRQINYNNNYLNDYTVKRISDLKD